MCQNEAHDTSLERYHIKEHWQWYLGQKVDRDIKKCRKWILTIWGKIGHTNFKQAIYGAKKKSGPGGLNGNMKERRTGWDRNL
jgi:hypothetical protein